MFQIATNLAYDHLRRYQRWRVDAQDQAKALASAEAGIGEGFQAVHRHSASGAYDIREHIDFCFTCIGKTLPLPQQVALLLKDVYDFSIKEIAVILADTEGVTKHRLFEARQTMRRVFADRCALINKNGICHQCSELNGVFNPQQNQQTERMKIEMVRQASTATDEELYQLRAELVRHIDPLRSSGADLQDAIMQCTRQAIGELDS